MKRNLTLLPLNTIRQGQSRLQKVKFQLYRRSIAATVFFIFFYFLHIISGNNYQTKKIPAGTAGCSIFTINRRIKQWHQLQNLE